AEDGIRSVHVTGVQTCARPIWPLCPVMAETVGRIPVARGGSRCGSGQGDRSRVSTRTQDDDRKDDGFAERIWRKTEGVIEPFARSEEHTSELQSREKLVCRLLL